MIWPDRNDSKFTLKIASSHQTSLCFPKTIRLVFLFFSHTHAVQTGCFKNSERQYATGSPGQSAAHPEMGKHSKADEAARHRDATVRAGKTFTSANGFWVQAWSSPAELCFHSRNLRRLTRRLGRRMLPLQTWISCCRRCKTTTRKQRKKWLWQTDGLQNCSRTWRGRRTSAWSCKNRWVPRI